MLRRPTPGFEGLRNAFAPRERIIADARDVVRNGAGSQRPATLADQIRRALDKDDRR